MASPSPAVLAFVLHSYPWSESSLVLDLFTREQGRLTAIAKGAKRPSSQLRSVLLPMQRVSVVLSRPPRTLAPMDEQVGDAVTLRSAEWAGGVNHAMPQGPALFSGFYLNELLMRLMPRGDPHPGLFDIYTQTLQALMAPPRAEAEAHTQSALRAFELFFLRDLGYLPDFSHGVLEAAGLHTGAQYGLAPEQGVGRVQDGQEALPADALQAVQAALNANDGPRLMAACRPHLSVWRVQLRHLLDYHLGYIPLRTREVLQALTRLQPRTVS